MKNLESKIAFVDDLVVIEYSPEYRCEFNAQTNVVIFKQGDSVLYHEKDISLAQFMQWQKNVINRMRKLSL